MFDAMRSASTAVSDSRAKHGKTPDELALFGIPRPGHDFWTAATVDAMEEKYPGLDVAPWRDALK